DHEIVVTGRDDQTERQRGKSAMQRRGREGTGVIEFLRPSSQCEASSVFILLGDRRQRVTDNAPPVLLKLVSQLPHGGFGEALVVSRTRPIGLGRCRGNFLPEHKHALPVPKTGDQARPVAFFHSAPCYCPSQAMLRHTVFDSDLAFSAEAIRSTRVVSFPLVSSPLRNAWRSGTQGALLPLRHYLSLPLQGAGRVRMQPQSLTMACVLGRNGVSVIAVASRGPAPGPQLLKFWSPIHLRRQKFSLETI